MARGENSGHPAGMDGGSAGISASGAEMMSNGWGDLLPPAGEIPRGLGGLSHGPAGLAMEAAGVASPGIPRSVDHVYSAGKSAGGVGISLSAMRAATRSRPSSGKELFT